MMTCEHYTPKRGKKEFCSPHIINTVADRSKYLHDSLLHLCLITSWKIKWLQLQHVHVYLLDTSSMMH